MDAPIRRRQPIDLPGCVDALATVFAGEAYPTHWPADPARWLDPGGDSTAWIATNGTSVLGHVALRQCAIRRSEICRLFVVPAARGRGLAAELLSMARDAAGDDGLHLEVADHNQAAIGLYERHGWRRLSSYRADWLAPDAQPALVHRYAFGPHTFA